MLVNEFLEKLLSASGDEALDLVEQFQAGRIGFVECSCGDQYPLKSDGGQYLVTHCQCRNCALSSGF